MLSPAPYLKTKSMKTIEVTEQLKAFYQGNKEGKGGGFPERLLNQFADQEKQALKEDILLRIKRIEEDNFNIQNVYGAGGRSALNSLKDFIEGKVL